ncbi:peptidase U32 family protein [Desulforhopalus singaporensis]|uniref:Putative protease n=1 Tax=Desulforhopalus singaporensis TaxID=91360 RepID=A0A1H0UBI3_9BACT|nr:U32 family peptidase [Desulforhopalus singaporensis]SDP63365.1 putative protease [Desulforhopalus singaporensis]
MDKNKSDIAPGIISRGKPLQLPELLAPAGNYEKLVTAVHYGADAVYLGGKKYSLRAKAGNFSLEAMRQGVVFAHEHGVKVYVTVNIFAHNRDLADLPQYLVQLEKTGVDGLILSDPGILETVKKVVPALSVHLSTQANVTNKLSAEFWLGQGASRLNLARELNLEEIAAIRNHVEGELEIFVHGALCISYSGRCMLSNYLTGRDANQGSCAHPCRFSYALMEEKRPGEYFPVDEDERGTYIFNSKDLCLLEKLPLLVASGVDSLKIEGRMKSIFYVGGVVRVYRRALDYLATLPATAWQNPEKIVMPQEFVAEIHRLGTRGTSENFIIDRPGSSEMIYSSSRMGQASEPVAVVRENSGPRLLVEMRNTVFPGETVEYMDRGMADQRVKILSMTDEQDETVEKANPGNRVWLELDSSVETAAVNGIFRRTKIDA